MSFQFQGVLGQLWNPSCLSPGWVSPSFLWFCDLPISMMNLACWWLLVDVLYNLLSGSHLEYTCTGLHAEIKFALWCFARRTPYTRHTKTNETSLLFPASPLKLVKCEHIPIIPFYLWNKTNKNNGCLERGCRGTEWMEVWGNKFSMVSCECVEVQKEDREHSKPLLGTFHLLQF